MPVWFGDLPHPTSATTATRAGANRRDRFLSSAFLPIAQNSLLFLMKAAAGRRRNQGSMSIRISVRAIVQS
jgi:hypothetical protein